MTILYQVFWTLPYEDKAPELCLFIFCKIPRAQIHWCLCEALPQSGSHFQDFADLLQPSVLPQLSLLSVALSSQQQRTQKSVEGSMDIFLIYNTGLSNLCARLWTPLTWLRSPSHFKYPLLHLRNTLPFHQTPQDPTFLQCSDLITAHQAYPFCLCLSLLISSLLQEAWLLGSQPRPATHSFNPPTQL